MERLNEINPEKVEIARLLIKAANKSTLIFDNPIEQTSFENIIRDVVDNYIISDQLEAANEQIQGLKANAFIQEHIIESGSNPLDKDKIVSLIMENASLKCQLEDTNKRAEEAESELQLYKNTFDNPEQAQYIFNKYQENKEAEADGVLVRLPYRKGTKVYCVPRDGVLKGYVVEQIAHGYSENEWLERTDKDYRFIICHNSYDQPKAWQLRDVYATREEAEREGMILWEKD